MSPFSLLQQHAQAQPQAIAVEFGVQQISYAELFDCVTHTAHVLVQHAVRPGQRVALLAPRDLREVVWLLAVWACQAIAMPLNRLWQPPQIAHAFQQALPTLLLCASETAAQLRCQQGVDFTATRILSLPLHPAFDYVTSLPQAAAAEATALLLFTSGSTGLPKGVCHSYAAIMAWTAQAAQYLGLTRSERILGILPLCFSYGLQQLLLALYLGATYRLASSTLALDVLDELVERQITVLAGVPLFWQSFLTASASQTRLPCTALRVVTNAGGHCPRATQLALYEKLSGAKFIGLYGMTETLRSAFVPSTLFPEKAGALGIAVSGAELCLVNAAGQACQPGEVGEIVQRGGTLMQGYWGASTPTLRAPPAWWAHSATERVYYTGDLAQYDEDGVLWFKGRADRQVKVRGFRFNLHEVEEQVRELPFVENALLYLDEVIAEQLHLVVQIRGDLNQTDDFLQTTIRQHLRTKLANYMLPQQIHLTAQALPMNAHGKLDLLGIRQILNHTKK